MAISRPVIYYEYLFIPFLFLLHLKHFLKVVILSVVIVTDILISISHFYFFDLFNYIGKAPSLFISNFSLLFWLSLILIFLFFLWCCHKLVFWFEKFIVVKKKKEILLGLVISICTFIIFFIFNIFYAKFFRSTKSNWRPLFSSVGKFLTKEIQVDIDIYSQGSKEVSLIKDFQNISNDSSIAYKTFYHSSSKREILIIVESWSLLKDSILRNLQVESLLKLDSTQFNICT